jgi:hypothetical protein
LKDGEEMVYKPDGTVDFSCYYFEGKLINKIITRPVDK